MHSRAPSSYLFNWILEQDFPVLIIYNFAVLYVIF